MTLCPYTQLGCDSACKAFQNGTCPFDKPEPMKQPYKYATLENTGCDYKPPKRGRKPKQ